MKYIMDIEEKPLCVFDEDTQTYFPRLWRVKGFNSLVFDEEGISRLEVLNSDYIDKHYGNLQQDAYDKGYKDGRNVTETQAHDDAYQHGLEDAWEAARKIVKMPDPPYWGVFEEYKDDLFRKITAAEAIAKLKAYEEKQKADNKIEVGDEVNWLGDCFIVTRIFQPRNMKEQCDGIDDDGCVYHDVLIKDLEKTGRHFDIKSILEAMKE